MKNFLLMLAAGLTSITTAHAALPIDTMPFEVEVPNLDPGIEFQLTGLLLQPDTSFDYAAIVTFLPNSAVTYNVYDIDPSYHTGFELGLGHIFPCSGNDIRLSWLHFYVSDDDAISLYPNSNLTALGPLFFIPIFDLALSTTNTSSTVRYDAIDLDIGQFVNIGRRLQTRIFGGLRYARVSRDFTTSFSGQVFEQTPVNFQLTEENTTKFSGVGPLMGFDAAYNFISYFGLVGHLSSALLLARVQVDDTLNQTITVAGSTPLFNSFYFSADDQTRIIPGLDGKFGLDFSYPFKTGCGPGVFVLEAGYQVTHYIDALDRIMPFQPGSSLNDEHRNTESIGFNGPYLSLYFKI